MKKYDEINQDLLKSLPNPSVNAYEIKVKIPEFTFLGVKNQPDFANAYISFYPKDKIIELKSLKQYVFSLRDIVVSYERLINIFFDHLNSAYDPDRLRLTMIFNPRGGISSKLTIDSDWYIRGGDEKYKDWTSHSEEWSVNM
jgi:7-cyano-7-deazaguanine reductase